MIHTQVTFNDITNYARLTPWDLCDRLIVSVVGTAGLHRRVLESVTVSVIVLFVCVYVCVYVRVCVYEKGRKKERERFTGF